MEESTSLVYRTSKAISNEIIYVTIRLNDECKNGHQDFAITSNIYEAGKPKSDRYFISGGANHDDILKFFPEFKIFINLHLCDYSGAPTYAVGNGFYHLKNGFNNMPSSSNEFKAKYCKYYRMTSEQFDVIKNSENETEYAILLMQLGVVKQWNEEAKKAIKILEKLTNKKFINNSVKKQFKEPTEEEILDFTFKKESGYYSLENKKKRAKKDKQEKFKLSLQKVIDRRDAKIKEIQRDSDVELWLITRMHKLNSRSLNIAKGIDIHNTNWIHYNHNNKIVFNWSSNVYNTNMTELEFDVFIDSLTQKDFEFLGNNISFELKGVKAFTNI